MLHATKSLFFVFGNAKAVATNPQLLRKFLCLPHEAVYELLQSNSLAADAEATVLLLLSDWCNSKMGTACSVEQKIQLNKCIRYSRLSTPFLTEVCQILDFPRLATDERMELMYYRSLPPHAQLMSGRAGSLQNPDGWYLPARQTRLLPIESGIHFTLKVSEAELCRFLKATRLNQAAGQESSHQARKLPRFDSTPVYSHGFWWQLSLSAMNGLPWCGFIARGESSLLHVDSWVRFQHGIMCRSSALITGKAGTASARLDLQIPHPVNSNGMGCLVANARPSETTLSPKELQWWEPFLVVGFVNIHASIWDILA